MSEWVGAVILLRHDGAALFQLRDRKAGLRHAGMWVPPGGHAEPNESVEICAKRELLEETDYDCGDLRWLTELDDHVEGWPRYRLTVFWAIYDGVQSICCREGQALKFIRREEADAYDIPPYLIHIWDIALEAAKGKEVNK